MKPLSVLDLGGSLFAAVVGSLWYLSWASDGASDVGAVSGILGLLCGSIAVHKSTHDWPSNAVAIPVLCGLLLALGAGVVLLPRSKEEIVGVLLFTSAALLVVRFVWLCLQLRVSGMR